MKLQTVVMVTDYQIYITVYDMQETESVKQYCFHDLCFSHLCFLSFLLFSISVDAKEEQS